MSLHAATALPPPKPPATADDDAGAPGAPLQPDRPLSAQPGWAPSAPWDSIPAAWSGLDGGAAYYWGAAPWQHSEAAGAWASEAPPPACLDAQQFQQLMQQQQQQQQEQHQAYAYMVPPGHDPQQQGGWWWRDTEGYQLAAEQHAAAWHAYQAQVGHFQHQLALCQPSPVFAISPPAPPRAHEQRLARKKKAALPAEQSYGSNDGLSGGGSSTALVFSAEASLADVPELPTATGEERACEPRAPPGPPAATHSRSRSGGSGTRTQAPPVPRQPAIAYDRAPRPVQFRPYSYQEYQRRGYDAKAGAGWRVLGGLGPAHGTGSSGDEHWQVQQGKRERQQQFGQAVRRGANVTAMGARDWRVLHATAVRQSSPTSLSLAADNSVSVSSAPCRPASRTDSTSRRTLPARSRCLRRRAPRCGNGRCALRRECPSPSASSPGRRGRWRAPPPPQPRLQMPRSRPPGKMRYLCQSGRSSKCWWRSAAMRRVRVLRRSSLRARWMVTAWIRRLSSCRA